MKEDLEQLIIEKNLTAPRITSEHIKSKIKSTEYVTHVSETGKILRWCILNMENSYSVVGDASVAVSIANDNEEIGKKVAYGNSFDKLWSLEGYQLATKLAS